MRLHGFRAGFCCGCPERPFYVRNTLTLEFWSQCCIRNFVIIYVYIYMILLYVYYELSVVLRRRPSSVVRRPSSVVRLSSSSVVIRHWRFSPDVTKWSFLGQITKGRPPYMYRQLTTNHNFQTIEIIIIIKKYVSKFNFSSISFLVNKLYKEGLPRNVDGAVRRNRFGPRKIVAICVHGCSTRTRCVPSSRRLLSARWRYLPVTPRWRRSFANSASQSVSSARDLLGAINVYKYINE